MPPAEPRLRVGVMRSALVGTGLIWADDAAERQLAHAVFGTPLDARTLLTEPHGFWWGVLINLWPASNFLEVWVEFRPRSKSPNRAKIP